jgi:hypothetical protein
MRLRRRVLKRFRERTPFAYARGSALSSIVCSNVPRWYEKAGLLAGAVNSQLSALDTVQKETGYEKE